MKHLASMKPKMKARKSHDDFYIFGAMAKHKATQYKDVKQIHSREPYHVRGPQFGSAAYMLATLYNMIDAVDAEREK